MKFKFIMLFLTTTSLNILSSELDNPKINGRIIIDKNSYITSNNACLQKVIKSYNHLPAEMFNQLSIRLTIALPRKNKSAEKFLIQWQRNYNSLRLYNNLNLWLSQPSEVDPLHFGLEILSQFSFINIFIPIYVFINHNDGSFKQEGSILIGTAYGETWKLQLDESFSNNALANMLNQYQNYQSLCNIQ